MAFLKLLELLAKFYSRNPVLALILIFFSGFCFRLFLSPLGFHDDILSNVGWGEWIYKNGPNGFYGAEGWIYSSPTQPPFISYLYGFNLYLYDRLQWVFTNTGVIIATYHLVPTKMMWFFDFTKWFGETHYWDPLRGITNFHIGGLISMKIVAIITDILIALIIYLIGKNTNKKMSLALSIIYLFSPFSWYLSSLWGQYDQLGFLFLLLSAISLLKKYLIFVPLFLVISFSLKPTSLIFIPIFTWMFFRQSPKLKEIFLGLLFTFPFLIFPLAFFTDHNLLVFVRDELIPKIFFKSEFRVTTNSFNFWHILIGDQALNQNTLFLFIPAKIWGWGIFILLNALAFWKSKKINLENIAFALFLVGGGGWLFLTNMLDRYFFAGIMMLIFVTISQPKLLKYWLILSLIFWLNLFNHWWFPNQLVLLKDFMVWQDSLVTRLLATANVVIFILVVRNVLIKTIKT